jgi:hypothetical protein
MFNLNFLTMKAFFVSVLAILFAFTFTTASMAQPRTQEPKLGIKGGLNLSNFYTSEIDDRNALLGFHAGLYYRAPLGDFLAIQPEILFSQRGADFSSGNIFTDEMSLRLNYIDVPVLGVLQLTDHFNVHVGPYVGFLIGDPSGTLNTGLIDADTNFDRAHFHRIDYGLSGGIGLSIWPIKLGLRYNLGLSDIGRDNLADMVMGNTKNSMLQFYIGL